METLNVTTETVLQHHLQAFLNNDLEEIMNYFHDDAEVWGPEGVVSGREAITSFFSNVFTIFPKGASRLELKQQIIKDEKAYLVWTADTPMSSVPLGTDSFLIRDGKIIWQSFALHMVPKS